MNSPIVAVTDRLDLLRIRDRHPNVTMTVVAPGDLGRIAPNPDARVVIDIDLMDPGKLQSLKANAAVKQAGARIILVDRGVHGQIVQAKGLGATEVLPRPLTTSDLLRIVAPSAASPIAPRAAGDRQIEVTAAEAGAERASIQAGADLLVSLFARGGTKGLVDMASVNRVGDQVVAAVSSVGLDRWLTTVRVHHAGTFQHCLLVTGTAAAFGRFLGLRQGDLRLLTATALLHDIGKAAIPLEILNKPHRLTDDEFEVMRQHPVIGYDMLAAQPEVPEPARLGVRHHHEYLDGSGYPDHLSGAAIPDLTRMLTVVDIYAALIEKRAYKKPRTPGEAMTVLRDVATGGKIDRALTTALGAMVQA